MANSQLAQSPIMGLLEVGHRPRPAHLAPRPRVPLSPPQSGWSRLHSDQCPTQGVGPKASIPAPSRRTRPSGCACFSLPHALLSGLTQYPYRGPWNATQAVRSSAPNERGPPTTPACSSTQPGATRQSPFAGRRLSQRVSPSPLQGLGPEFQGGSSIVEEKSRFVFWGN